MVGSLIGNAARRMILGLAPHGSKRLRGLRWLKWTLQRWLPAVPGLNDVGWAYDVAPPLDPYDAPAIAALFRRYRATPPGGTAADAELNLWTATRWLLGSLQHGPELRRMFPRALSEGADGAFCHWLCGDGSARCGLSPLAIKYVREAFERRPGDRVLQLFGHQEGVRLAFPLGLTPAGRRPFVQWLLGSGRRGHGLRSEEIAWFLLESEEDHGAALATTYLLTPEWQRRFPHALTRFGQHAFLTWLRQHHGIHAAWFDGLTLPELFHPADELRLLYRARPDLREMAPRAFVDPEDTARLRDWLVGQAAGYSRLDERWWQRLVRAEAQGQLTRPGVNVLGHFCYPSGLGQAARTTARALETVGVRTVCRDLPAGMRTDNPDRRGLLKPELFDVSLLHVAPEPNVPTMYPQAGLHTAEGVRRIAVWYWELESVPAAWKRHARHIDEIWAPTKFIADAMAKVMPVPVVPMAPGVEPPTFEPLPRSHFGLPEDRPLFLFAFDMNSVMERKNPLGLIDAFRQAFPGKDRPALAIKVSRGSLDPKNLARLRQAAQEVGAFVIDRVLSRSHTVALLDCCDAYVSLHRSEGFGLTLAEAMLLGKPVITTAYSGNMDFTTPANSLLVGYRLVPIREPLPFYPKGCHWAEPDVTQAAEWMRWVVDRPTAAQVLGLRARLEAQRLFSLEAAGERMLQRLHEIRGEVAPALPVRRAA